MGGSRAQWLTDSGAVSLEWSPEKLSTRYVRYGITDPGPSLERHVLKILTEIPDETFEAFKRFYESL